MDVKQTWEKIFLYWKTIESKPYCQGATTDDIKLLQEKLQLKLPDEFIKSLMICNDEKLDREYEKKFRMEIEKNPYKKILLGKIGLLEIKEIIESYAIRLYTYCEYSNTPKEWIPLTTHWYGTYESILDTREGTFGQVLFSVGEEDMYKVWANSYEEWLELIANEVTVHGEVREEMLEHVYKDKDMKQLQYPDYI